MGCARSTRTRLSCDRHPSSKDRDRPRLCQHHQHRQSPTRKTATILTHSLGMRIPRLWRRPHYRRTNRHPKSDDDGGCAVVRPQQKTSRLVPHHTSWSSYSWQHPYQTNQPNKAAICIKRLLVCSRLTASRVTAKFSSHWQVAAQSRTS
jgi:hypothetical protein